MHLQKVSSHVSMNRFAQVDMGQNILLSFNFVQINSVPLSPGF